MDDEALIERARSGDREAFGLLFDRHRDHAYAVAFGRLRDQQAALDVTQEAFLKALARLDQLRDATKFAQWLSRIVEHGVRDHHRRAQRLRPLDEAGPERADPAALQDVAFERSRMRDALDTLGPRLRRAMLLRYDGGCSYEQIASALGISTGTVASRLSRAHRRLALVLGAPGGGRHE